jgi:dTMP kinase
MSAIACLVTADRYQRLDHDVRPALRGGSIVLCDRYVPTSLVLQRIDGVQPPFLLQLNQYADVPDLTVILTGDPEQLRARAHLRGTYSRFYRDESGDDVILYHGVGRELIEAGWPVIYHQVTGESAEAVATILLAAILERIAGRSG